MANIFLDSNVFFDIQEQRNPFTIEQKGNSFYISALSLHIYFYVFRYKMPYEEFRESLEFFKVVDLTNDISVRSLEGPTKDFEDNVQLYSAVEAECDKFYTRDEEILRLGYFGKVDIQKA